VERLIWQLWGSGVPERNHGEDFMHIRIAALCGVFLLVTTGAHASDPMANTYTNTVFIKNKATGEPGKLLFNSDGSYVGEAPGKDGKPIQIPGKWTLKNDGQTICLAPILPPNTPNPPKPACSPLMAHGVGDRWSVTNDQGQSFDVSLVAGR
jgi:hypothetical protein